MTDASEGRTEGNRSTRPGSLGGGWWQAGDRGEEEDRPRLLLVEDDDEAARAMGQLLRHLGYEVAAVAGTADEAVAAGRRDDLDLALADIGLPGEKDGIDAGQELAELGVPVVYLTAFADEATLARAEQTRPFGYVIKPAVARDIRAAVEIALQRHRLERRLRASEERFRLLIENAQDLITVLGPDGTIHFESPSIRRILGYEPEELIGRGTFDFVHPADLDAVMEAFNRVLQEPGRPLSQEIRFRHRDGSWRWLQTVGTAFRNGRHELRVVANSRDVTEQRRVEDALRRSEHRYRRLFESNVTGVYVRSLEGRFLDLNPSLARSLGYGAPGALVGSPVDELYEEPEALEAANAALRRQGSLSSREVRLRHREGRPVWVLESCSLLEDVGQKAQVVVGTVVDITEQKRLEGELARLAYTDPLTGLANRRLLEEQAHHLLALAERHGQRAALVYADLTGFKRVNDTLGHEAGDRVLVEVARRMTAGARESDVVARIGGDEFALLLTEVEDEAGAVDAARRFASAVEAPIELDGRTLRVRPRLGLALFPDHGTSFPSLLTAADRAMYAAGRTGEIEVWTPPGEGPEDLLALEEGLEKALQGGELDLYLQPILRLPDGRVVGAEALIRWRHPVRGLLPAREFLPAARTVGLIRRIDEWVLEAALRHAGNGLSRWGLEWLTVNLSADSLRDPGLIPRLQALLGDQHPERERLVLELTEETAVGDLDVAIGQIEGLKRLGFRVALDDFGQGHSSLVYLDRLPVDLLKLSGLLIGEIGRNPEQETLTRAIVQLGHAAGLRLVVEAVERAEQADWLHRCGCDFIQGHHIAKPLPPEEFEAWLRDRHSEGRPPERVGRRPPEHSGGPAA